MASKADGGEIGEAIAVGAARGGRERPPGAVAGIKEVGGDEGGVLGEDAEDGWVGIGGMEEPTAEMERELR